MINPRTIITYAQYREDLILGTLLDDVKNGFYIDVGANFPVVDSVTYAFYQKGWSGINIEPIATLCKQLNIERPRDINIQCGIGDKRGSANFREYKGLSGHSTFSGEQKAGHDGSAEYEDYEVEIKTLKNVIAENKVKHIHFLKIDVEGFEYEVVAGNNWQKNRPEIICIEANHVDRDWRPILISNKYKLFIADGLNEYYIAEESWHRIDGFSEKMVKNDALALRPRHYDAWMGDLQVIENMKKEVTEISTRISTMDKEIAELKHDQALTLRNRPFLSRAKRSLYGLTVDWYRYFRHSRHD